MSGAIVTDHDYFVHSNLVILKTPPRASIESHYIQRTKTAVAASVLVFRSALRESGANFRALTVMGFGEHLIHAQNFLNLKLYRSRRAVCLQRPGCSPRSFRARVDPSWRVRLKALANFIRCPLSFFTFDFVCELEKGNLVLTYGIRSNSKALFLAVGKARSKTKSSMDKALNGSTSRI